MTADPEFRCAIDCYEVTWPFEQPDPKAFDWIQIRNETCCITCWYYELLGSSFKGTTPRLFIDLNSAGSRRKVIAEGRISLPFNFENYLSLDPHEKKKHVATVLRDGLVWLAKKRNQDAEVVKDAFEQMKVANFTYQSEFKRRFPEPKGKLVASIGFTYDIDGADMTVRFKKRGGRTVIAERKIGVCPPHPWLLHSFNQRAVHWTKTAFKIDFAGLFKASVDIRGIAKLSE